MESDYTEMVWRDTAIELILERRSKALATRDMRSVALDAVAAETLAESIVAPRDVPARDRATMDGFAVDATAEYPLTVTGEEVFPEDDPPAIDSGDAVRIATGAPLPPGANAVLKREDASLDAGQLRGPSIEPRTYTYERGSNLTAGETLFECGERLSPKDAILLGDLGRETVTVYEPFSVGVVATGTEIHEGRTPDLDSNMLAGLVRSWGHDAAFEGSVPDEYDRVEATIDRLTTEYDIVLTTGGTSVGHKDHVVRVLDALGEVDFHRVRIRPGKPLAMATLPDHDAVAFAVPGKPIGAQTIATLVVRPFFTGRTALSTVDARITHDVDVGPDGFEYVVPVVLDERTTGYEALPLGHAASPLSVYDRQFDPSVLSSSTRASRADGITITTAALHAGEPVSVIPYPVIE